MPSHMSRTIKAQAEKLRFCNKKCIVERFQHNRKVGPGVRSDLLGIFDLLAFSPQEGVIAIQVCGADFSSHYKKITEEKADEALIWLASGRGRTKIEIWSWRYLLVKRGGKKRTWQPRVRRISYEDFKGHYRSDKNIEAA